MKKWIFTIFLFCSQFAFSSDLSNVDLQIPVWVWVLVISFSSFIVVISIGFSYFKNIIDNKTIELEEANKKLEYFNNRLELEIKEKKEELENSKNFSIEQEKAVAIGNLIYGVAHEMNTPLGAIISSAENLNNRSRFRCLIQSLFSFPKKDRDLFSNVFSSLVNANRHESFLESSRTIKKKIMRQLEERSIPYTEDLIESVIDFGYTEKLDESIIECIQKDKKTIIYIANEFFSFYRLLYIIDISSKKLSKIVTALRSYSYSNSTQEEKTLVSLSAEIENVLTILSNKTKKHISIIKDYRCENDKVFTTEKISLVFMNLINNALQAMEYKGQIIIRIYCDSAFYYIEVQDDGPGVDDNIRDKIFSNFFTTKKRGEGTGLGLNMCNNIIVTNGGQISFTSQPGQTIFKVSIPKIDSGAPK